jgi:hypothetical protein
MDTDKARDFLGEKAKIASTSGDWVAHNIITPHGYTISPNIAGDHFRLRRILQIVSDCQLKPLKDLRVIDFGCHEGLYSIEFARHGASVVGVEGRQIHLDKAEFIRTQLGLHNLQFICDDVRNFRRNWSERFDIALCTGILYHLGSDDGMRFLDEVCAASLMVVVDTHIGLNPDREIYYKGRVYWGYEYSEPAVIESDLADVLKNNGAAIGNRTSYWLGRGSLMDALQDFGCTSVFEVGCPTVPGQFFDRVTVVGVKGRPITVLSAPAELAYETPRHGRAPCLDTAGQSLPQYRADP